MTGTRVTVIPHDRLIAVDGQVLRVDCTYPEGLHALHGEGQAGEVEYEGTHDNEPLAEADYALKVAPFVLAHEAEAARRAARYASEAARAERVRGERNRRLAATDAMMLPDFTVQDILLNAGQREEVLAYRAALKQIPTRSGFPWTGPDDPLCPWPDRPGWFA